jgi:hypothetical protein
MAFGNGPRIVTDGLVLALDAADRNSYVSGSTTWADMSTSKNNSSLNNSPAFSSANGGNIIFDGTDDSLNFGSAIDFADTSPFSAEIILSIPNFTSQTLSRVHWLSSSGGNSMMVFNATYFIMWNQAGGVNSLSINYNFPLNTIFHTIITRDSSNIVSLYVNGSLINTGSRSGQFIWATMARLSNNSNLYCSNFSTFLMRVYNQTLSASQVLQNYNAQKSRFGL